ncbi:hypothetical protein B0H17DRAFT_1151972 [Mycena rosella]|uniref:Uncharacterized protein n=1 Tax=Mycena rosella TaxID=1033263 RepID=A0AAD7BGQ4_MYCRO|nr:hypothetical protein B0H17DRAFT_1151972 [Mycena rosella]
MRLTGAKKHSQARAQAQARPDPGPTSGLGSGRGFSQAQARPDPTQARAFKPDPTRTSLDGLIGNGAAFDHDAMRENIIFLAVNGIDVPFSTNPWSIHDLWVSFWSSGSGLSTRA